MIWFTSLLMWVCVLHVLPIQYFVMRNEAKFKKNIVVGVTLPYEARENPDVIHRLDQYIKELKRVILLLLVVVVPCVLIRTFAVNMFFWGLWLIFAVVLPNIPFARCNRDLREIKRVNGWSRQSRDVVWVDTAAVMKEKWLSPWVFVPAVLLCLLPLLWDRDLAAVYVLDAVCVLFCWAGYRYLYRNRAEAVDANGELTQVLSRVRRRNWGRIWLYCAYSLALINLSMWLVIGKAVIGMVLILLLSGILVYAAVRIELQTRRVQEKLTQESGKEWYVDEDDKWIWGLLYYNPNDSRVIINSRVGTNSTVNLARPAGKILTGVAVMLLLTLPFFGVLLDGIGSKPLDLQINGTTVIASYGGNSYEVETGRIESAEILEVLPKKLARVGGTSAETLLKGKFRSPEYGSLTLCLDPTCPPFLLIRTHDGRNFLFGAREGASVLRVFTELEP